jgi:hypothetical protein
MTRSRQTADWGSRAGLAKIVPSSVAVGSGTGSANSLGTVTFSGASSVSLNDVFSTTYQNYKVVFESQVSADCDINLRYRVSGSDNTSANTYGYNWMNVSGTTYGAVVANNSYHYLMNAHTSDGSWPYMQNSSSFDVINPYISKPTELLGLSMGAFRGNAPVMKHFIGHFFNNTSFTGFTMYTSTGTFTGTISVYGYTN